MTDEIRVVSAGRGAGWWLDGWRLFTPGVFTWIGIIIIYILVAIVISLIPYVGDVGHWLLTPVFAAGLMVGCQAVARGERLRVSHLFEGFQGPHFVTLIIIGAVNLAMVLTIVAIASVGVLGVLHMTDALRLGVIGDPLGTLDELTTRLGAGGLLATLLLLLIAAVFGMLNWFSPALVILRGAKPLDAMKKSFVACMRNWLPFLVYGLVAVLFAFAVMLAFAAIIFGFGATAMFSGSGGDWGAVIGAIILLGVLMFASVLIVLPIVFGATYAGYRDIFVGADVAQPQQPATR